MRSIAVVRRWRRRYIVVLWGLLVYLVLVVVVVGGTHGNSLRVLPLIVPVIGITPLDGVVVRALAELRNEALVHSSHLKHYRLELFVCHEGDNNRKDEENDHYHRHCHFISIVGIAVVVCCEAEQLIPSDVILHSQSHERNVQH